jgi:tRNA modification GTPase
MDKFGYGDEHPIVAYATPLAESALALIRTSGEGTIELCSHVFSRAQKLRASPGNTLLHGWIVSQSGENVDEVVLALYRAPHSFTGEDSIDITCHGGIATTQAVMQVLLNAGFRQALPGEFTFRAFMHGKMDLTRAESVMELVGAKTDEGRHHAVNRLLGALEQEIQEIKNTLLQALATAELYLDYSEDDGVSQIAHDAVKGAQSDSWTSESKSSESPFSERESSNSQLSKSESLESQFLIDEEAEGLLPARKDIETALQRLKTLAASYQIERLYQAGALVAIAGRPNAGKSSIFNRLLKEERSIVTDVPGTTRDYIEGWISIEGIPIRLVDTAGLREVQDLVEQLGVARSRSILEEADVIIYCIDGTQGITPEDMTILTDYSSHNRSLCLIWNKVDIAPCNATGTEEILESPHHPLLSVSAKTGEGIHELARQIASLLCNTNHHSEENSVGIASERQKILIDHAISCIEESLDLADERAPLDIIAPALREAVTALGEITGEVSTADILEAIFSRFCVGK